MKGTFVKQGFKALVTMFFLFGGLFMTANRADAQTTYNWMTESQALDQLGVAVEVLSSDLANNPQGSQIYVNAENHLRYYKQIIVAIEGGSTVPVAVETSLIALSDGAPAPAYALPKAVLEVLHTDAIGLLTL